MCATCGCSDENGVRLWRPGDPERSRGPEAYGLNGPGQHGREHSRGHEPGHSHSHSHSHGHGHGEGDASAHAHVHAHDRLPGQENTRPPGDGVRTRTVTIEQDVLAKNDRLAARNRARLRESGIVCVNMMSSPGAGKTTLLERTIRDLAPRLALGVIEGDQETGLDALRIKAAGAPVVQINTGAGCHLDASMLARGLDVLQPQDGSLLLVENVGNLVCPALFDLGEHHRVVVMSVTEGPGKPLKYPHMFAGAGLILLNKVDLLPHLDFDVDELLADARSVNPGVEVLPLSATTGEGLSDWYAWLRARRQGRRPAERAAAAGESVLSQER